MDQMCAQFRIGDIPQRTHKQGAVFDFCTAQRLEQRRFKCIGDRHDLAGRLHLRSEAV